MQTVEEFLAYSAQLEQNLKPIDDLLGLIYLGSTADLQRVDQWSDHDFWVVVKDGTAEQYRQDLTWLPMHDQILFAPRDTQHGLKVMYQNGHILEFAIFDDSELEIAGADDYSVPLDKTNITARMAVIAGKSTPKPIEPVSALQLYLTTLTIGVGRARRGETLIAHQFVHSFALAQFLGLLKHFVVPVTGSAKVADTLNPFRRVEKQYPQVAAALSDLFALPLDAAAQGQLALLQDTLQPHLSQQQVEHINFVRAQLGWAD
jgi:hypothetical protein